MRNLLVLARRLMKYWYSSFTQPLSSDCRERKITPPSDAAMPRGALMLADQSMSEATLGERLGSAWTWKAPTDEVSLMLVSRTDPTTDATSTGEPAPVPTACFGTPCTDSAECLPGLRCMVHPGTGEGMCVTTCLAAPICDVEAVSCGAFIPKVAPVECIDGGCFPTVCDVLADCPAGSIECDAGLCY